MYYRRKYSNIHCKQWKPRKLTCSRKTSSITAVNSFGESGSPCLTLLFIGDSSDISLSKWIIAVARLYMLCKVCTFVSFLLVFPKASEMAMYSAMSKAFS